MATVTWKCPKCGREVTEQTMTNNVNQGQFIVAAGPMCPTCNVRMVRK